MDNLEENAKKLTASELEGVAGGDGRNEPETVIAYYEDGNTEILTPQGDGTTFITARGALYYLGDDGVYRSRDYANLYVKNPTL